jgi:NTE family protein
MKRRQFLAGAAALAAFGGARAERQHKVALVLGGGGCRGYGHLGVLRVLERERLRPDLVVGSSAGSLVGALYAAGLGAERIEKLGAGMTPNMLRDWIFPRLGFFGGAGIARFVREQVGVRPIETLPIRFAAVATDLRTGEAVMLERGDVGLAVQASSSAPGLLEPVIMEGRLLVDGNIVAPVPVSAAHGLGARRVVAVDVTFPPEEANLSDPFDALYQGFSILTRKLAIEERNLADVMLAPQIPEHDQMSSSIIAEHVRAGERAASAALPALRRLFA